MSMAATHAVRAAGGPSSSTLMLAGVGIFVLANPEKALLMLQRALLALSSDGNGGGLVGGSGNQRASAAATPIVIHAGNAGTTSSSGTSGLYGLAIQLSVGAGLCWGSYALLVNVLPEQAKNMLPVTQGTFKSAVTSLGKGLLNVKDSLSAEIAALLNMQTDLQTKQDDTHEQVLYVQDQVADVHDDLGRLDGRLDETNGRLAAADKRTTYIARGIRLVSAGMTALLPADDELIQELHSFTKHTDEGALPRASSNVNKTSSSSAAAAEHRASVRARRDHYQEGSQGSSSRRSRNSRSVRRSKNAANRNHHNKPTDFSAEDTLSVSTGTPIRQVIIPHKTPIVHRKSSDEASIVSPELKELEEVRALLERMDDNTRRSMPMM